jgi:phosphoserine phosphatase
MTTIYITRHGETLWNTLKKIQGWSDSPLTDKGIKEAELLSKRLKDINLDIIYSSPSGRAFKTAEILKGSRKIDIIPRDNFREIHLGEWEGKDRDYLSNKYGEAFERFWSRPDLYEPFEGESFKDIQNRAIKEMNRIVKENQGKTILIVTHTVTIKVIMAYYQKRSFSKLWDPPFINQTSLSRLDVYDDRTEISMYADDSHLNEINNKCTKII